jgi:septal ring factor EnvC (AmiA/AmiB activator)
MAGKNIEAWHQAAAEEKKKAEERQARQVAEKAAMEKHKKEFGRPPTPPTQN